MANILGIVGLVVGVVALVCSVLALALPYWDVIDIPMFEANIGLWRYCLTIMNGDEECDDTLDNTPNEKSSLKATRAMAILGMLCISAGLVTVILLLFIMKDKKILGFISGALFIVGGLFQMIAMAVFLDKLHSDNVDVEFGAGFVLDIIAWIVAWIAGALVIVAAVMGDKAVGQS